MRWGQHHAHRPAAGPGKPEVLTGWVDVQLLDGGDAALGFNWTVTLHGSPVDALDQFEHYYDRDTGGSPFADLQIDDGARMTVVRRDPWSLWLDHDHVVHTLVVARDVADELQTRGLAGHAEEWVDGSSELAYTVEQGRLLPPAAVAALAAASELSDATGERSYHHVQGAWSTDLVSNALAVWARAVTGVDAEFTYVDPVPHDGDEAGTVEDDDVLLAAARAAAATLDATAEVVAAELDRGNVGPGGYPSGVPWRTYPTCGWRELPDGALIGERPKRCMWPARVVGVDETGAAAEPPLGLVATDGYGSHPAGAPACDEHADELAALGWTLLRSPSGD